MPAPDIYDEGSIVLFADCHPMENIPYAGNLYATDRLPADDENKHDIKV